MKNILLVGSLVGLFFGGCVQTKQVMIESQFNKEEAKKILQKGKNTIIGSALINQRGGGNVNCSGRKVTLIPYTEYAKERIITIYGNEFNGYKNINRFSGEIEFVNTPTDYYTYTKTKLCDSMGFFKFNEISDGKYFIHTLITWQVSNYNYQGGHLMKQVEVSNGQTVDVVLAP